MFSYYFNIIRLKRILISDISKQKITWKKKTVEQWCWIEEPCWQKWSDMDDEEINIYNVVGPGKRAHLYRILIPLSFYLLGMNYWML